MFVGMIGLLMVIVGVIWLVVQLIKKNVVRKAVIMMLIGLALFVIGVNTDASTPVNNIAEQAIEAVEEEVVEEEVIEEEIVDEEVVDQIVINSDDLEVHFIDVGQGDAILIKSPMYAILIDGGKDQKRVFNYLRSENITQLDLLITTHPHADHIGGLIEVIANIQIKEVIDPMVTHTSKTFEQYLDTVLNSNAIFTEGRKGMTRNYDDIELLFLYPVDPSEKDLNNASIVVKLVFDEISFLFAGDIHSDVESLLVNSDTNLNSTVLKVAHHGSESSSNQIFLQAVSPEIAIIMCGANNSYGHPHDSTLSALNAINAIIYRTDLHGHIIITTDGNDYNVTTTK